MRMRDWYSSLPSSCTSSSNTVMVGTHLRTGERGPRSSPGGQGQGRWQARRKRSCGQRRSMAQS